MDSVNIKLFGKWSYDGVKCNDISLQDYIEIRRQVFLPHSAGRYAARRFRKAKVRCQFNFSVLLLSA